MFYIDYNIIFIKILSTDNHAHDQRKGGGKVQNLDRKYQIWSLIHVHLCNLNLYIYAAKTTLFLKIEELGLSY